MDNQRLNIQRTFRVLNSLLVPVLVLSLADILNLSFLVKFSFILVLLITASLKIYLMSGLGGCLIEVISGQEYVIRLRRIHRNAMELWPGFLLAFLLIRLADFLCFALVPVFRSGREASSGLLVLIGAFMLARWVINKKYINLSGIPKRKFCFKINFLSVVLLAFIAELVVPRVFGLIPVGGLYWHNLGIFMLNYIHVFEFIFCSLCIFDNFPEITGKFSSQKEIFLINPMGPEVVQSVAWLAYWAFVRSYPPFFVVLKALTPKSYVFREFNRNIWHERYYKGNVLVCITCFTSNCYEAYKIAKEFRKRGAKVVMGGPHVTYLPQEALAFCDSVVVGQAEGVWKQLLQDYENGALKAQYKGTATELDHGSVHEELLNSPPYIIKEFLETTRGCKFRCHFCTIPALSDGQVRTQSINDFVGLINKVKPHYSQVTFIDNNIYSDPGYARELFAALKPLKIKWQSMCTIDIARNRETLKLARESGCVQLMFGYEIFNGSVEKNQGGKFAMAQKYKEYTRLIKKEGIKVDGRFIFGFDSDNLKTLFELWKFCFSIMPVFTVVSLLTPLPGTGVYRDMLGEDRIINLNWRNYSATKLVVSHPHLNPALMSCLFIWVQTFFLMTTSSGGIMLLVFCSAVPFWIMSLRLFT